MLNADHYTGTDCFTCAVGDGNGGTNTKTITVSVVANGVVPGNGFSGWADRRSVSTMRPTSKAGRDEASARNNHP